MDRIIISEYKNKANKTNFYETKINLFINLRKALLDPLLQRAVKLEQDDKEVSKFIEYHNDYKPELKHLSMMICHKNLLARV